MQWCLLKCSLEMRVNLAIELGKHQSVTVASVQFLRLFSRSKHLPARLSFNNAVGDMLRSKCVENFYARLRIQ